VLTTCKSTKIIRLLLSSSQCSLCYTHKRAKNGEFSICYNTTHSSHEFKHYIGNPCELIIFAYTLLIQMDTNVVRWWRRWMNFWRDSIWILKSKCFNQVLRNILHSMIHVADKIKEKHGLLLVLIGACCIVFWGCRTQVPITRWTILDFTQLSCIFEKKKSYTSSYVLESWHKVEEQHG
jgi:hypothetical protein